MFRKSYYPLTVAAICLSPAVAAAQDFTLEGEGGEFAVEEKAEVSWENLHEIQYTNEGRVGVGYVSQDSAKFGEYTGLEDEGVHAIGSFRVRQRSAYDSDSADFFEMSGSNLGIESRTVEIKGGRQGQFEGHIGFDQIPKKFITESAQTPFDGAGSTNLTLPSNWDPGTTTAGMDNLVANLKDLEVEHDRKRGSFGFSIIPMENWEVRADYQHEEKDGDKTVGAVIGNSGGNPRAALIPEPIDYSTDDLTVALAYADPVMQAELGYYLSLFDDDNDSLTWQNPFSAIAGWDASAGFPTGQGRLGLPPDNEFHQINFSGGYNIDMETSTRATLDASYGWMLQDQSFLPYTVNPDLVVTTPLPRDSLDGEINTTLVNLGLTSRPIPKVYLRGNYRYDDRDNDTPIDQYIYIGGDSTDQSTDPTSDRFRFNRPYSYTSHKVELAAGHDFLPRTYGEIAYEFENIERTFAEVEDTYEHTGKGYVRTTPIDNVTLNFSGSYGSRNGSDYRFDAPLLFGFSPEHIEDEAPDERFESHPLLRKFFEADRNRIKLGIGATLTPTETLAFGLKLDYVQDDYNKTVLGLRERESEGFSADISYVPIEDVTTYAFYTYENVNIDQGGHSIRGSALAADLANLERRWTVEHDDDIHTAGVGVDWWAIEDRLNLKLDYVFSRSTESFSFKHGTALTSAGLPTIESTLHSVGAIASYNLMEDMTVELGYRYENYQTFDWALDDVNVNTLANVITLGDVSPDYSVHLVATSLVWRF